MQRREGLEPFLLPMSGQLEHLLHLQLVCSVGGAMRVLDIIQQTLKLFPLLGQNLRGVNDDTWTYTGLSILGKEGGGRRERGEGKESLLLPNVYYLWV